MAGYIQTSKSIEWETPIDFFKELDSEFRFDLDVCSTDENAKCKMHFTKEDDGLSQNWGGTEFSVILHMVGKCRSGLRRRTTNETTQS